MTHGYSYNSHGSSGYQVKSFSPPPPPQLSFSVYAWMKLQWFCHAADTEVGAFGITDPENPLHVVDMIFPPQKCTTVSVDYDDQGLIDFAMDCAEANIAPANSMRVWIHTHPGNSPTPSSTDEETLATVYKDSSWAVMFILARGGATYCRLRANPADKVSLSSEIKVVLPTIFDYMKYTEVPLSHVATWEKELKDNVSKPAARVYSYTSSTPSNYTPVGIAGHRVLKKGYDDLPAYKAWMADRDFTDPFPKYLYMHYPELYWVYFEPPDWCKNDYTTGRPEPATSGIIVASEGPAERVKARKLLSAAEKAQDLLDDDTQDTLYGSSAAADDNEMARFMEGRL